MKTIKTVDIRAMRLDQYTGEDSHKTSRSASTRDRRPSLVEGTLIRAIVVGNKYGNWRVILTSRGQGGDDITLIVKCKAEVLLHDLILDPTVATSYKIFSASPARGDQFLERWLLESALNVEILPLDRGRQALIVLRTFLASELRQRYFFEATGKTLFTPVAIFPLRKYVTYSTAMFTAKYWADGFSYLKFSLLGSGRKRVDEHVACWKSTTSELLELRSHPAYHAMNGKCLKRVGLPLITTLDNRMDAALRRGYDIGIYSEYHHKVLSAWLEGLGGLKTSESILYQRMLTALGTQVIECTD